MLLYYLPRKYSILYRKVEKIKFPIINFYTKPNAIFLVLNKENIKTIYDYNECIQSFINSIIVFIFFTEFQEAFNLFDNRGDGKIQQNQIGECLRALGQNPTEADVKKFTQQLKPDERISFEVFLPIYQGISRARSAESAEDFIEGLRHFDKDASGFISTAELRHLLTTLGEKLTDDEVEQLLANQEDSQGNVNYEEFVKMVMSG